MCPSLYVPVTVCDVTFDSKLSFGPHLRSVAVRAQQRLGLMRRAAPILSPAGLRTVYNGFVRPVMEYATLVWMGAPAGHLGRLDRIQRRAINIIGPSVVLQSLDIRRRVSALTYIYKLHYLTGPPQLAALLPPSRPTINNPRTRGDQRTASGHPYQLASQLSASAPAILRRAFPFGVRDHWNALPAELLQQPPHPQRLQQFKSKLFRYLRDTDWLWATTSL